MSLPRAILPMTSSPGFVLRTLQPCHKLTRTFSAMNSSIHSPPQSSKRKMQTSTAYTPDTFKVPPPPRNSIVPDTSIAGTIPQVNETRPPHTKTQYEQASVATEESGISLPEQEAQKPKTVAKSPSLIKAKPRPKLRARKAAMSLTPGAVEHLRALLDQPNPKLIKVSVRNRGCSGLAYQLDFVDKPDKFDEAVEQDGVKVLIDSKALFSIIGSEMDWVEDKLSQRFVFKNPNIKEQCGCGESFMV